MNATVTFGVLALALFACGDSPNAPGQSPRAATLNQDAGPPLGAGVVPCANVARGPLTL